MAATPRFNESAGAVRTLAATGICDNAVRP